MDMSDQGRYIQALVARPEGRAKQSPLRFYVGGLSKSTSEEVLFQYFSQFGEVTFFEIARSRNRQSRSMGFGYLEFAYLPGLVQSIESLKHNLGGRELRVEQAHHPNEAQSLRDQFDARRLYLSGIPSTVTPELIWAVLIKFGIPESITSLRRSNPYSNPNSFYCYVTMDRPQAVEKILQKRFLKVGDGKYLLAKQYISSSVYHKNGLTAIKQEVASGLSKQHKSSDIRDPQAASKSGCLLGALDKRNNSQVLVQRTFSLEGLLYRPGIGVCTQDQTRTTVIDARSLVYSHDTPKADAEDVKNLNTVRIWVENTNLRFNLVSRRGLSQLLLASEARRGPET